MQGDFRRSQNVSKSNFHDFNKDTAFQKVDRKTIHFWSGCVSTKLKLTDFIKAVGYIDTYHKIIYKVLFSLFFEIFNISCLYCKFTKWYKKNLFKYVS